MRTAGEGGLSPVFASRAAVLRPAPADYRGLQIISELNLTAGGEILVSGMFSEIAPARPSKADFAIRIAHKSGLEERHVRSIGYGMRL